MRAATVARVVEHRLLIYRRSWRGSVMGSFLNPILFLTAMGLGLGSLVDGGASGSGGALGVPYLAFLAPGLLAGAAMQTAAGESMFPVMAGFQWSREFRAVIATPAGSRELAVGFLAWVGLRLLAVGAIFVAIMVAFGAVRSPLVLLAIPAAALTGLAFAAPITAFAATRRQTEAFNVIFRFGITPLFIFSGTFFPVESLPAAIQPIAWLTPLYHGVALARGLSLATIDPLGVVLHGGYLVLLAGVGTVAATITFRRRLER
jgi:lipooligosaccharide transport system permease protein